MRYELNDDGYISKIFFGCQSGSCTEYTGSIPTGYTSLEEWEESEEDKLGAWKIVDGNLVYDANKYKELQSLWEVETDENTTATHGWVNNKLKQTENILDEELSKKIEGSSLVLIEDSKDEKIAQIKLINKVYPFMGTQKVKVTNGNMLMNKALTQTVSGVTFTINEDKTITLNGTATTDIELNINGNDTSEDELFFLKQNTNYYLNSINNKVSLKLYSYDGTDKEQVYSGNGGTIYLSEYKKITQVALSIASGKSFSNEKISLMLGAKENAEYTEAKENALITIDLSFEKLRNKDYIAIDKNGIVLHYQEGLFPSDTLKPKVGLYPKKLKWKKKTLSNAVDINSFEPSTLIQCSAYFDMEIRYYSKDYINTRFSNIEVKQNEIVSEVSNKVGDDELGTKIIQNWQSVQMAWNQISQYLQFEAINNNASMVVYNNDEEMLMKIDKDGQWFYDNNDPIGKIGTAYRNGVLSSLAFFIKNIERADFCFYDNKADGYVQSISISDDGHIYRGPTTVTKAVWGHGIEYLSIIPSPSSGSSNALKIQGTDGTGYYVNISTSDGRLKKNIQETKVTALDKLNQIKFREFDWKNTNKHQKLGYIAQELEEIDEDLVFKVPQTDNENNVIDYIYQIDNNNLITYLTKAVTELSQKVEEQQEQINFLMKKLNYKYKKPKKVKKAKEQIKQYKEDIKRVIPKVTNRPVYKYKNGKGMMINAKN